MVDFQVTILQEKFQIEAESAGKARREAARQYQKRKGDNLPLGMLVAYSSVDRLHPRKPGAKPKYNKEEVVV